MERATSLITIPCRQPDLVARTTVVNRLAFGAIACTLFKGSTQEWGRLRATPGFGVFWFILPSWLVLSPANLLYREDFLESTHRVQYQSKILRQKVKKIETKSQKIETKSQKNWDKKSKKLRLKVKKIETKSQKNWDKFFLLKI